MKRRLAPDGTPLDFPDAMTDAQILSVMQEKFPKPDSALPQSDAYAKTRVGQLEAAGRGLAQGATYGGMDEIAGAGESLMQMSRGKMPTFEVNRALESSRDKAASEQNPWTYGSLELAGLLASPANKAFKGNLAAQGAQAGGVYGFLNAEPNRRIPGAALGGSLGGAGGYLLPSLLQAGKGVVNRVASQFEPFVQSSALRRAMIEMERDRSTVAGMRSRMDELGPEATFAELGGRNLKAKAQFLAKQPGETMETAGSAMTTRAEGRGERVINSVKQNISPEDYYGRMEAKQAERSANAERPYKTLYDMFPNIAEKANEFKVWLNDPAVQKAYKEGTASILRESRTKGVEPDLTQWGVKGFDDAGEPIMEKVPIQSMRQWDAVKKGLDRMINDDPALRNQYGKLNGKGQEILNLRNAVRDKLDDVTTVQGNSLYKQARDTWAGPSSQLEAMTLGRAFAHGDEEVTMKVFNRLGEAEKESFRIGVARELVGMIGETGQLPKSLRNVTNSASTMRSRLEQILPRGDFNSFIKSVKAEGEMAKFESGVLSGSPTQPLQAQGMDMGLDMIGAVGDVATQGLSAAPGLLRRAWQWVKNAGDISEKSKDELGRMLFSKDPTEKARALQLIEDAQNGVGVHRLNIGGNVKPKTLNSTARIGGIGGYKAIE